MKIIATVPTYNEADNIVPLANEILALGDAYHVLVVDDNSPDGTWRLVREMMAREPRVQLLHRTTDRGRGTAGLAGFIAARDAGADAVVEMDADFSHHPRFIPSLVEPVLDGSADIVVGSRLVAGGGEQGRHVARTLITRAANSYIALVLGLPLRDCTSGFRVFSRRALETIPWEQMTARGPEIVQEVLWEARLAGLRFAERPILFENRRAGQSTFNWRIAVRSLAYIPHLRLRGSVARR
ncbi:MAG: polyprenol monophosphomannose synthase [Candidatus Sumerlaeaceae bacterium]|nr:polyprenol monophosphomannose synthase [Candidatus Sumerlaeaceae bacterium]